MSADELAEAHESFDDDPTSWVSRLLGMYEAERARALAAEARAGTLDEALARIDAAAKLDEQAIRADAAREERERVVAYLRAESKRDEVLSGAGAPDDDSRALRACSDALHVAANAIDRNDHTAAALRAGGGGGDA